MSFETTIDGCREGQGQGAPSYQKGHHIHTENIHKSTIVISRRPQDSYSTLGKLIVDRDRDGKGHRVSGLPFH